MFQRYGLIRRMLPALRPFRLRFGLMIVLTIVATIVGLFEPWPFAFLIDSVLEQDSPFPSWLEFAEDWDVAGQIAFAVAMGFLFTLVTHGIAVIQRAVDTRLELGLVLNMRSQVYEHVQRLSFQYHDRGVSSHYIFLINEIAHDTGALLTGLVPLGEAFLLLIGMFVVMWLLDPQVALAASAIVPLVYLATARFGRRMDDRLVEVRELEGGSIRIIHEKLSMIKVVVSFGREKFEHSRFYAQAQRALGARVSVTISQTVFGLVVALITAGGTAVVLYITATAVARGELTVGELTVILAYLRAAYQPIEQITYTFTNMQMQLVRISLLFESLDSVPEVIESPNALELDGPRGRVTFDDVSFNYKEREHTLDHVSFTIEPGEFVAIVGPTGAGKSTLVSLIPRFFEVHAGRVLIDDHDVRDLTIDSVRNSVALVLQEPLLFSGSIADNIRYGHLDATDEEVEAAARMANCHDFILSLPYGYETMVGERGTRISGGERQRIALARAFLKKAPVLILDEPTSSIDSRTEAVILDALYQIAAHCTTIMIAHRLSTIRRADRILVMDEGRIVEQGTHSDLLALDGVYAELWRAQTGGDEPPESAAALGPVPAPGGEPPTASTASPAPGAVETVQRPTVVVLGMMTKIPVAGVVWQTMHYLVGLRRLGVDAYYVEAHARTPSMLMEREDDDGATRAAAFIDDVMRRFGFEHHWAFHALHDDGAVYGMSRPQLTRLYANADLIINLHGGTDPLPEHAATGRLVYIETDPVQLQIELFEGDAEAIRYLDPHVAFFTFGENYGRPDCRLPVSDRFRFLPTRQPVVADFWAPFGDGPAKVFTTIGNWRQPWREVKFRGETYHWTKHLEFLRFLDVPRATGQRFELALSSYSPDDKAMLERNGWQIAHALDFSVDLEAYRSYIGASRGEFTVAKDQNVRLRTGWFSDRSATYLAAGRPVITQDTGFGNILPTGEGLFAFESIDDVLEAVAEINSDYERHRSAARAIAREYFDHEAVLRPLLSELGVQLATRRPARSTWSQPAVTVPDDLDITVVRRRPTTLKPETVAAVLGAPIPDLDTELPTTAPSVSVVVVTHDGLVFSRLCLESLLANTSRSDVEVLVVDNASSDMTVAYLDALAEQSPRVRVMRNDRNLGFAVAVNQALARARGEMLVILNNDTIVPPGWLDGLERHLADPGVGMVCPVTNASPNEARIEVPYTTYGGFVDFADGRCRSRRGASFDIDTLTMFCVAFRRDVYDLVGGLDERFEIGMFEDDDYAFRVRAAGRHLVCAEDVVVHHFGEASFGWLVPTGEYNRIFAANKARFEDKWKVTWHGHRGRPSESYLAQVDRVRRAVADVVPTGSTVLVVSKGDEELLAVPGRTMIHFPSEDDGTYAGWYPASTDDVVARIERHVVGGAGYVVFPLSASWWFDYYEGLDSRFRQMFDEIGVNGACRIFASRQPARIGEHHK